MSTLKFDNAKLLETIRIWKKRLTPTLGPVVICIFLYLIWNYRDIILNTFRQIGILRLAIMTFFLAITIIFTVYALVILVRDKGYTFGFADGYHSLNLSQLASMIPGGVWGYAGFAGMLWAKGIARLDGVIIIFTYTLVMLSACVIVGFSGLITILGWGYAVIFLFPFLFLLLGRNWMDKIRGKHYPQSSPLPSASALLKALFLGILVWIITASCFAWLLYAGNGRVIPFWTIVGAYTTGYLGGYIAILVPSGLGISEGLVTLLLGSYMDAEKIMATAISFRIVHMSIVWFNMLMSVILTSGSAMKNTKQ